MTLPTDPDEIDICQGALHPDALKGIRLFNAGAYFEAHEELETAWRAERGRIRDLYQGILQVGVAYYHLLRGNHTGAIKMIGRALPLLDSFPDTCRDVNVAQLRRDARAVEAELLRLGPNGISALNRRLLRPVAFDPPQEPNPTQGEDHAR